MLPTPVAGPGSAWRVAGNPARAIRFRRLAPTAPRCDARSCVRSPGAGRFSRTVAPGILVASTAIDCVARHAFGIFPRDRLPLSGRLPFGPMPASHRFVPKNVRSATPWKRVSGIAAGRARARIRCFAFAVPPPQHQPGFPKAPWPALRHKRLMPWQFPVASSLAYSRDALMTCESHQGGKCCRCL